MHPSALINKLTMFYSILSLCRALLTAFKAFCECVGDLEMGKVGKLVETMIFSVLEEASSVFLCCTIKG